MADSQTSFTLHRKHPSFLPKTTIFFLQFSFVLSLFIHHLLPSVQTPSLLSVMTSSSINGFYSILTNGLNELEHSFVSNPFMSLEFLRMTLTKLRSFQSNLIHLIQNLHLPPGGKWLDECMDENTRLLDACQLIKTGAASMEDFSSASAQRLSSLQANQVMRALSHCRQRALMMERENKAETETTMQQLNLWFDTQVTMESRLNVFNGFKGVLYAMKNVSTLLLLILLWGLVSYYPTNAAPGPIEGSRNFGSGFMDTMSRLQQNVDGAIERGGILMHEFQRVKELIDEVQSEMEEEKVENLKGWFDYLRVESVKMVGELDDFQEEIVEGGRKLLSLCK